MSRQAWRYQTLPENTRKIKQFCETYGFEYESLNNGYQIRVERVLDLYPVRGRYHNLTTEDRGGWTTKAELRQLMLEAIPRGDKRVSNIYEVKPQPQVMNVLSVPAPKRLWPRLILAKIRRFLHV